MGSWKNITKLSLFLTMVAYAYIVIIGGDPIPKAPADILFIFLILMLMWGLIYLLLIALVFFLFLIGKALPVFDYLAVKIIRKLGLDKYQ